MHKHKHKRNNGALTLLYGFQTAAQEERVVVTNKHGEKLVGLLQHMGSNKIVVICHGFTASKVHKYVVTEEIPFVLFQIFRSLIFFLIFG